jgi:hypothetical protein
MYSTQCTQCTVACLCSNHRVSYFSVSLCLSVCVFIVLVVSVGLLSCLGSQEHSRGAQAIVCMEPLPTCSLVLQHCRCCVRSRSMREAHCGCSQLYEGAEYTAHASGHVAQGVLEAVHQGCRHSTLAIEQSQDYQASLCAEPLVLGASATSATQTSVEQQRARQSGDVVDVEDVDIVNTFCCYVSI